MTPEQWNKEVKPPTGFDLTEIELSPKKLEEPSSVEFTANYEPFNIDLFSPEKKQIITVYPPPMFLMSRSYSPYLAKDIRRFKGYLSKFEPEGMSEEGEPEAAITIEITEAE